MVDVTIRGAGVFGLTIAWNCLQRGARVQVVDPNGPGSGASGGVLGALAPHVPENWNEKKEFQFQSLLMAEPFWARVEDISGLSSGYGRTGRLQPIADDRQLQQAQARAASARDLWQGQATWQVVPADRDWAPASPTGWLIHDTLTARLHPRQACRALASALERSGAQILTDAPDRGAVVHATGVHDLIRLSQHFGRTIGAPIKGQAAILDHDARTLPQIFADTVHIVPHGDGTTAIGSTTERDFTDPTTTDSQLDDLMTKARQAVPALANATVLNRWAGLRPRSRSRAPMLGNHPLHPNRFIANGGFKIGFGMAPKIGEVMADLILENRDTIPTSFRPEASL
ncbi:MAG: NAD(P)/FAD-dependent oxidoreductase [Paracoccaceae bacterium]